MASMSIGYKELVSVSLLNDFQFGISSMTRLEFSVPICDSSKHICQKPRSFRQFVPLQSSVTSESHVFLAAFLSFAKLKLPLSLHKVSITNNFKSYITQAHVIQELKMSLKGFEIEI